MKDRLFRLLGIEPEEESMVSMLLTQSVFLGIFLGAFDISAHSLFLSVFDEKAMARAYVVSGLAGIVLTASYTWIQARTNFKNFAIANLFFVTIFTLALWIALLLIPGKIIVFAVFVMLGPLNILAMLGFWGTTGRLFTLRQGKRLFGLVDAGLVFGAIVSCYAIPVLLTFNFKSHNILLISASSIFAAAVIQIFIRQRFTFAVTENRKAEKGGGLKIFRDNSYIRIMGIFIALSVMTAFFVMYSFMAVTRLQYPQEEDMARFLGLFTGSLMIFTLLIKLLVFSYLIRNYGLKTCLAISPILIAGFTAIAIGIGLTMGYTPESVSGFVIFFLILALSRLFSKSLKDSIESPSFKVIYQTVDEKIRYEVQSGIDGTVNEISALFSGLLLAGLGALSFIKLIHFSGVLFLIILAWIYFAFLLYREYRGTIRKSLEVTDDTSLQSDTSPAIENLKSRSAAPVILRENYIRIINGDLDTLGSNPNRWFIKALIDEAGQNSDYSLLPALRKISSLPDIDEDERHRAAGIAERLESGAITDDKLVKARKILSETRQPQTTEILRLLRDSNPDSRRLAIYMIGKFSLTDMIPEVCDCLGVHGLEMDAEKVLESFGRKAYEHLFRLFLSTSGNLNTGKAILRIIGRSCEKENTEFLMTRLWSNSRQIKLLAVKELIECNFRADETSRDKLNQLVSEVIGMLTWNIAAQVVLKNSDKKLLTDEIQRETSSWISFLFSILSIIYDRNSIEKIKVNIESGTVASVNYALEMIDIVVDESIKPKLIALIDAVPEEEKLKNLHQFYPGEISDFAHLVEDILNRDYNLVKTWTKACALRSLDQVEGSGIEESVIALLFSPNKILREEAANLIRRTNSPVYKIAEERIPDSVKKEISAILSDEKKNEDYLFEKTAFLVSVFGDVEADEIISLADSIQFIDESFSGSLPRESFLFMKINSGSGYPVSELFFGNQDGESNSTWIENHGQGYILPLTKIYEYTRIHQESAFHIFNQLNQIEFSQVNNR